MNEDKIIRKTIEYLFFIDNANLVHGEPTCYGDLEELIEEVKKYEE